MEEDNKNFKLRYVGGRFNGARLPVDVLSDLPAFRDLLVAFAKERWRSLNSDRTRVPRNFDKGLSFDLVAIENGSAIPNLNWNKNTAQENLAGFADELEEIVNSSYENIVRLIDGAGHDRFPQSLSAEHIRALNKLGAGLRDDERIEFLNSRDSSGQVVYLDNYRRKKLITRVRNTYQTRFESTGNIRAMGVRSDTEGFVTVSTSEHGEIQISVDPDQVSQEFNGNLHADVQFELQIELGNR